MTVTLDDFEDQDSSDTVDVFLTNISYTERGGKPIVHVFGRDVDGNYVHQEVYGHNPHFSVPESEYDERVANHYAVENVSDGLQTLDGEDTYRIETSLPKHVGDLRNFFENPLEADVLYETRWLIDNEITTGIRVPANSDRCHVSDIEPCEPPSPSSGTDDGSSTEVSSGDSVQPRIVTVDIEVASEHGFPEADEADWPVVSIVATDSYTDEYVGWILRHESHGDIFDGASVGMRVRRFDDEQNLLDDFNHYIEEQQPDILTGWNSNDFDYPYLINRCRNLDVWSYMNWSPLEEVYTSKYGPVCEGVAMLDMMQGYEKTQIHSLDDRSLDAVAADELDAQKLEFDGSYTDHWKQRPVEFLQYNKRDTELVTSIDDEAGVTELFTNLRDITGVSYEDPVGGNFELMDVTFLRMAREYGLVLPTAEEPDITDGHGGYVYSPVPGLHDHVVYPDFSKLYPSCMIMCNISPETMIGTSDDLEDSQYTEDDCVWSYIDTTTKPEDKSDVEATDDRIEKIYYLSPNVDEGFVRSVVEDIIGLADDYTGKEYEAVKRIRNSVFGYVFDADSYGTGSRLYDWRLGESITLAGQHVLKEGGRQFADMVDDPDASVVYGDTDAVVTTIPNAEDGEDALQKAFDATESINDYMDSYAVDTFGIDSEDDAMLEIEMESYASRVFFKSQKKRYCQLIEWDEDEGWIDDPEPDIKGFEYVRSDVAQVTKDVQEDVFNALLRSDKPRDEVFDTLEGYIDDAMGGSMPLQQLGIRFGMSKEPSEYGSPERTPQPQYRGAKWANDQLYGADAITSSSDPLYYYIDEVRKPYRKTYSSDTAEDGRYVDAISVLDGDDIPDEVVVDRRTMVEKTILSHVEDIVTTMGWSFEHFESYLDDCTPPEYWRESDQLGLDAESYM